MPKSIVLPTIPELLRFVAAHATNPVPTGAAVVKMAQEFEEEADIIERAYTQTMEYMELWAAFQEAAGGAAVEGHDASVSRDLQALILDCHAFIVHEATVGSAEAVVGKLGRVSKLIRDERVVEKISAAFGDLPEAAAAGAAPSQPQAAAATRQHQHA